MVTVRCLISLSVQNNWPLYQLDVNNAFLYGDLKEEVYMQLPPGYYDKNETKVCNKNDYSLHVKIKNDIFIAILVYVDDIVITENNEYEIGIEVLENKNGLCLSQRKYCLELLSEYGLLACKPAATPLQQNVVLSFEESKNDKFLPSMTKYHKIVGKLIYLSITRHDISYVVHCLSHHMHVPLQSHFTAVLRVLRYLKNTPDWAKCPKTRKFVSGFCLYLCNNLVSWKSKKQATISRSSAEFEYRCLASTTCELIWVIKILKDLEVDGLLSTNLYCDSSSAISIARNPVASANNVADIFTKGLSVAQHAEFYKKLRLVDIYGSGCYRSVTAVVMKGEDAPLECAGRLFYGFQYHCQGMFYAVEKITALARPTGTREGQADPFYAAAQEARIRYYGDKLDDINVVVTYITTCKDVPTRDGIAISVEDIRGDKMCGLVQPHSNVRAVEMLVHAHNQARLLSYLQQ
ncbi:ribonuclease H-like domain-containing protein [Tanacetum coccineum]